MKMRWLTLGLLACVLSGCSLSELVPSPVVVGTTSEVLATVNGVQFTRADLNKRVALVQLVTWLTTGGSPSALDESDYVDKWIDTELMAQAAAKAGFSATEAEAQQEIGRLLEQGKLSDTDLLPQLGVQGLVRADLVQYEQRALSIQQFANTSILANVPAAEKPARLVAWLVHERSTAKVEKPTPAGTTKVVGVYAGALAPNFSLTALDGSEQSLDTLHGTSLLVNFWATWCVPCRNEMPAIQQAYDARKGLAFAVLGVNVGESHDQVDSYARELGLSFPLLLDDDTRVSHQYHVFGLPTTVFIGRTGVIQEVIVGEMSKETLQANLAQLLR